MTDSDEMQTDSTMINEAVARQLGWILLVGSFGKRLVENLLPRFRSIAAAWEIVEYLLHNMKPLNLNNEATLECGNTTEWRWRGRYCSHGDLLGVSEVAMNKV